MNFRFQISDFRLATTRVLFGCVLAGVSIRAETPAQHFETLRAEAERALRDGVPDVAVEKFRRCLDTASTAARGSITVQLAQALLGARRASEALDILRETTPNDGMAGFVKAQALAASWRWSEALPFFEKAAGHDEFALAAKLGQAETLHALNRTPEATVMLEALGETAGLAAKLRLTEFYLDLNEPEKSDALLKAIVAVSPAELKWATYVKARLLLARGGAAAALPVFQGLIKNPENVSESLLVGVTLGLTDATLIVSGPEQADNAIEDFVWRFPQSMYLDQLFQRLDQIYAQERSPSESELQKWTEQKPPRRAALAQFYLAKMRTRENKTESAVELFDGFVKRYPEHLLVAEAQFLAGQIKFVARRPSEALAHFEAAMRLTADKTLLGKIELAAGATHFSQREFVLAANLFRSAALHAPKLGETALFNAALAQLYQGNYERFLDDYKELSARFPDSEVRRELILEEGLLQARAGDLRAEKTLKLFIKDFPENRRLAEARLALAEIAFLSPSRRSTAGGYIKAAYESPHTEADSERAAYLSIFLADADPHRDDKKTIGLCRSFIERNPQSKLLPEVEMKLGQIYFRIGDFANARTLFETLANAGGGSPMAETALFLAGHSAMKMMGTASFDRAIELFESVTKMNGPLKLYARQEQATAKIKTGKESEALIIYNDILAANPDAELKFAVMCGKGDALFAMGNADAKYCEQAIAAFGELAGLADITPHWRNQSLYKKGKCLERLSRNSDALTAFYDVLESQTAGSTHPEYLWFYKAGFDAARLLEAQQQWKSALGIYRKIAALEGPRAQEARTRASQLRLEHFLWEE